MSKAVVTYGASAGGIGLVTPLTILFVALKLTNTIAWPWIWVLSPLWIGAGLWVVAMIAFILIAVTILKD